MQEVLGFSIQNVSPSAEGEALRNGGCGACSVHARSMGGKSTIGLATSGMFVCCCVDVACGCSIVFCKVVQSTACETNCTSCDWRAASVCCEGKSRTQRVLGSTPVQEVLGFSIQNMSLSAEGKALRNGGCGACSVHARSMVGACSENCPLDWPLQ